MKILNVALAGLCLLISPSVFGQNCGYVDDFRKTVVDNGDSTLTYNFEIDVETTSGGDKSVLMRLDCNSYLFESSECLKTDTSTITYYYGPYTLHKNICNISPSIIWTGHTNDKCGGSTCIGETITLPVTMLDFSSTLSQNSVVIDWSTASELNNSGFEVQHSVNGVDWTNIGWVDGHGNSQNIKTYQYVHDSVYTDINYYRLKQIDFDGQFEYTQVTVARLTSETGKPKIRIFPNPINDVIQISGKYQEVRIYNASGNEVSITIEDNHINTSSLIPGLYFAEVTTTYGKQRFKLVK